MRTPVSGNFIEMPLDYTGISEIEFIKERPSFTRTLTGTSADSMYDVGTARPVISSMASSDTHTIVLYSYASACSLSDLSIRSDLPTSANLYIDVYTDSESSVTTYDLGISPIRQTRASIIYYGSKFYITYINGSSCVSREVTTSGTLPGVITSTGHGVSTDDLVGAVASFGSTQTDIWMSYRSGQAWYAIHVGTSDVFYLTSDYGLEWWYNTGFSIAYTNGRYILAYQHRPGLAACRIIQNDVISGPMHVMSSSDDYAYQFVRITGLLTTGTKVFALAERGIYNSDGIVSQWLTTLLWTEYDYLAWADWVGIASYPVRGGVGIQDGTIVVAGVGQFFQSDGVRLLGDAEWQTLTGAYGWTSQAGINEASGGRLSIARKSGQEYPSAGDVIRRKFRVSGTDFTNTVADDAWFVLSTESVDRPIDSVSGATEVNQMTSRGPIKSLLNYTASIDDMLDSGISRYDEFEYHTVVSESGNWGVSDNHLLVEDDDDGLAIAKIPESLPVDDFLMHFTVHSTYGSGIVLYEDLDNYFRIALIDVSGTRKLQIIRKKDASESVVGTEDLPFGFSGQVLVKYIGGTLEVFAGTANYYFERIGLTATGIDCRSERMWCGFAGGTGDEFGKLFIRSGFSQQTLRAICKTVAGRCGIDMTVEPLDECGVATSYDGTEKVIYYDVELHPTNQAILYLGAQSSGAIDSGIKVTLSDSYVSVHDASTNTPIIQVNEGITYDTDCRVCVMPDELNRYTIAQVYVNHKLLAACVLPSSVPSGYVNLVGHVDWMRVHDLSYGVISHVWRYGTSGAENIRSLVNPMLYAIIEQPDFSVRMMAIDGRKGEAGNIENTVTVLDDVPDDNAWGSLIKVEGAEVFGMYIEDSLLNLGIRPVNVSSPYLWTEEECVSLGGRYGRLFRNKRNGKVLQGFLNPSLELLDAFSVDGVDYVVESIEYRVGDGRKGESTMRIHARRA